VIVCATCGTENPAEARFCMACASPLTAEEPETGTSRRTVTVVFTDVVESTPLGERLDPEALRRVMSEYFYRMRGIVEGHGGTVEKFIGDAVMAVFGIPTLHEDDALRAARAAVEMRDELSRLNVELESERGVTIAMRTGVNTGEVVAGDPSRGQTLAIGDPINTAARLEQAASPGEILLGGTTRRLLRDAVRAEPVEPLALKGKAEPVAAFRLEAVEPGAQAVPRRLDSPMVGRERERQLLQLAFERAVEDRTSHLVTVLGPAGVGKSRLIEEFLASLPEDVAVLRGRCLPYGEGITFWPVTEVIHQAAGITADDAQGVAADKLRAVVGEGHDAELVQQRVAQVIGLVADGAVPEETFWGIRRFLEALARDRPVAVVFDDIHWGEPTFLDLVEHLADWTRDAAILVCCLSRNELLDARPGWGGGKVNATTVLLEPLSKRQCDELIENLLGRAELNPDARDRIVDAAEGNPLFVEEMLSMLIDDGLVRSDDGHWIAAGDLGAITVPPSIQALLAARLDRLEREERGVVERASVVGRVFYRGAVSELSPEPARPEIGTHLRTLVRRELIRPYAAEFDDETYRFRHLLIRDAAYEAMPKELRADLHERFAGWLEHITGERLREYEEIIGYHLEQAHRYRTDLGPGDEASAELARRAGELLGRAGVRATGRGDIAGGVNLLTRAVDLLPADDPQRLRVLPDLAEALLQGAELDRAGLVLQEVTSRASEVDASVEIRARVVWALHRVSQDPAFTFASALREVEGLVARAQDIGDDAALAQAQEAAGGFLFWLGRSGDAIRLLESAIERGRARGMPQGDLTRLYGALSGALVWGAVPVDEGIARLEQVLSESSGLAEAYCRGALAQLRAMRGEIDEARTQRNRAHQILEELGSRLTLAADQVTPLVEMLAGDPAAAEAQLREGIRILQEVGETGFLSTSAAMLGQSLVALGRNEEAEEYSRLSEENAARDDLASQVQWRTARSVAVARQGRIEEGEALAREAVSLARRMDYLTTIGDALVALAEVLVEAGKAVEAAQAANQAVGMYERKGDRVSAGRARRLMEELGE
jgi:class 3 adenylate cyclase/tetratricopeptide (TPR) repeat protein